MWIISSREEMKLRSYTSSNSSDDVSKYARVNAASTNPGINSNDLCTISTH